MCPKTGGQSLLSCQIATSWRCLMPRHWTIHAWRILAADGSYTPRSAALASGYRTSVVRDHAAVVGGLSDATEVGHCWPQRKQRRQHGGAIIQGWPRPLHRRVVRSEWRRHEQSSVRHCYGAGPSDQGDGPLSGWLPDGSIRTRAHSAASSHTRTESHWQHRQQQQHRRRPATSEASQDGFAGRLFAIPGKVGSTASASVRFWVILECCWTSTRCHGGQATQSTSQPLLPWPASICQCQRHQRSQSASSLLQADWYQNSVPDSMATVSTLWSFFTRACNTFYIDLLLRRTVCRPRCQRRTNCRLSMYSLFYNLIYSLLLLWTFRSPRYLRRTVLKLA